MQLQLIAGPGAGRRIALPAPGAGESRWVVGRDPGCDVVLEDPDISRRHLEIDLLRRTVRDLGSTNGARIDGSGVGQAVPVGDRPVPWPDGAPLVLGSCRLALRDPQTGPRAAVHADGAGHLLVNRAPRLSPVAEVTTVDYPSWPTPQVPARMPWAMALLPLLVAVPMALIWHQPTFLLFAVLSPLAALTQYLLDRRSRAAQHAAALAGHARGCAELDQQVAGHVAAQSLRHHLDLPDLAQLTGDIAVAARPGGRLWERGRGEGHLRVRLGLATLPAEVSVRRDGRSTHPSLPSVPLSLDLATARVIGLCGPDEARDALARSMIGQIAVWCSPREVHVNVVDPGPTGYTHDWHWVTGLPHAGPAAAGAVTVALVDHADVQRLRPEVAALLGADDTVALCLAPSREQLPHECAAVITLGVDGVAAQGVLQRSGQAQVPFAADLPEAGWALELAAALTDLRDATPHTGGAALPDAVHLLDLVPTDPARIARGWLEGGDPARLAATLGVTAVGPWTVDLAGDGPHVLVAGTTGAGKSELLTTMVAALATAHPPERLAFLLVDYKGGTAFAHLADLPHVTGVITDLDPALARRALTSLRAELRRRERLLAETPGTSTPRLVIVVDEFRVLAEEQPELLAGLVRVATVGRGLGVHLVLATQRPAGVVSADIKANTNLRIALRLRDRSDSDDVVEAPDAARIPSRRVGRAVLRRAGDDLVTVQVAHLPADDRARWLGSVQAAAQLIGARTPPAPWLPPLPDQLSSAGLTLDLAPVGDPAVGAVLLPYALADLPEQQRRAVLAWDLTGDGHLAVAGGPGSGRSTVLHTLAAAAGRLGGVQVHVIDAGGDLADLADAARHPHVGTVVAASDVERCARLVAALTEEAHRRRAAVRSDRTIDAAGPPPVLLLVDGWESVTDLWSRCDHGRVLEDLLRLGRDGLSAGVRFAVAGGRSLLGGTAAAGFSTRLLLPSADPHLALLAGVPPARQPRHWPPGRVLRTGRGSDLVEAQVVLFDGDGDGDGDGRPTGPGAADPSPPPLRLLPLPDRVELAALWEEVSRANPPAGVAVIGVGGDQARPVGLTVNGSPGALVCGPAGSGRSAALSVLAAALHRIGRPVQLVTPGHLEWEQAPGVVLVPGRGDLPPLDPAAVLLLDTGWPGVPGLEELALRHLSSGEGLRVVAAAGAADVVVAYRGLLAELRGLRTGVLIGPRGAGDGDALGVRAASAHAPPGRGLLVERGRALPIQVARPPRAPSMIGRSGPP